MVQVLVTLGLIAAVAAIFVLWHRARRRVTPPPEPRRPGPRGGGSSEQPTDDGPSFR